MCVELPATLIDAISIKSIRIALRAWRFHSDNIGGSVGSAYPDYIPRSLDSPSLLRTVRWAAPSHGKHVPPPFARESAIEPSESIVGIPESRVLSLETPSGYP